MYSISKQFHFEASHFLTGLELGHPCMRHHGHSYRVVFVFEGEEINEHGFLRDYRSLEPIKTFISNTLDHRNLNDVLPEGMQPTAENIAHYLFDLFSIQFPELTEVRVSETAKTWATYRPTLV
jgi:6-pyruvoyltetrahydropterin/6-carboxytetrahydropterin synthase